jgi:branched-chain amino acid transport system ATP-binding protein
VTPEKNDPILSFKEVSVYYGIIQALHNISFDVQKGQIATLVGANGAGKSTTLRAISGLIKPKSGQIIFKGENIVGLPAHEIVRKRLCQAPEGRGIFLNLSVSENMDLGAWAAPDKGTYQANMDKGFELFPRLKERRNQLAGTLSGGEQQMLAIARALMGQPELLLLDEPSLGLAPQIIEKIFEIITDINKTGVTIVLVEQNALQALQIAHYGIVFETGLIKTRGKANDLLRSDEIRKAYLGD